MQADGKILIFGTSDQSSTSHFKVTRILTNGQKDVTFGDGDSVTIPNQVRDVYVYGLVQPDGKIVIAELSYKKHLATPAFEDSTFPLCIRLAIKGTRPPPQGVTATHGSVNTYKVYPNPSENGHFIINYNGGAKELTMLLYGMDGKLIERTKQSLNNGRINYNAPAGLSAGMYMLYMSNAGECRFGKTEHRNTSLIQAVENVNTFYQ